MAGSQVKADFWVYEYITPWDIYQHGVSRVLAHKKTAYQDMWIVESGAYGKALVLDGKWQSCTGDEFLYHEPLVHPAAVIQGGPKSVLVLGGGEGATVREALRWKTVERVVMVDIDGEVVEACREHLEEMHQGAFDDPRTRLVIGDALNYLDEHPAQWDVIVSDLSDPIEEGPSFALFTKEYIAKCRKALAPGGVFVIQAGPVAPAEIKLHARLKNTVAAVFPHTLHYCSAVPTYGSPWGYILGSDAELPADVDTSAVDDLLQVATTGGFRNFDGLTLRGLLCPPKYMRDAALAETMVYTQEAPPRYYADAMEGGRGESEDADGQP
jgi:spermidine synthase